MKIVKVFLKIILFIILLFLATGLLVKEVSYQTTVAVSKPITTVFTVFKNPLQQMNWIKTIQQTTPIHVQSGVVGSIYASIIKTEQGATHKQHQEIRAFIPNQQITFFTTGDNLLKTDNVVFTQQDNKTIVTQHTVLRSKSYLQQCLFPYLKYVLQQQDNQHLHKFKLYIENNKQLLN